MRGVLVDSNVILDVFLCDAHWVDWSEGVLGEYGAAFALHINPVIYAEVSVGFHRIEDLESAIHQGGFQMLELPKEALFLAGKAFLQYRRSTGVKRSPLPDFFVGAQAAVLGMSLITRDTSRYRTYFPSIDLICPETA